MLQQSNSRQFALANRINRRWVSAISAFADQFWLSTLNFTVALMFIRNASKEQYAIFVLLQAPILLIQGVQNALFISPQATVLPASSETRKPLVKDTASAGQATVALSAALFSGISLFVYQHFADHTNDWTLATAFSIAILGAMAREGVRAARYAEARAVKAFTGDLAYGLLLLLAIAAMNWNHAYTARNVLLSMGLTGMAPLVHAAWRQPLPKIDRNAWNDFWACGRWALPSVLATWLNLNAYPYIAAAELGTAAVAELNASRLFLMPIAVSITAWSNLMRPKISALISRDYRRAVLRISLKSLVVAEIFLLVFVLIVGRAYPLLEGILGPRYHHLFPLIIAWSVYFAISLMRNIFMATLMSSPKGYRLLHHLSWVALALDLPALFILSPNGAIWVVGVLVAVELFLCAIIFRAATSLCRNGS